jgi:methylated-DNA-[protein]-cysteine S-methyltransferase
MSYREVAKSAGSPRAYRAVGHIMKHNTDVNIPCHRVIRSDGSLGPYNGLRGASKKEILASEGYGS